MAITPEQKAELTTLKADWAARAVTGAMSSGDVSQTLAKLTEILDALTDENPPEK